ncbi:hypothetical protein [Paenibacillus shenyangensis]|uniref:hypothetical protein n=1 Tax=Paenibacillus sp. A9 TaxID=1284352 RepID=UPI00037595B9|nr:hypothetical protein [Paenibacillus sp. A9]
MRNVEEQLQKLQQKYHQLQSDYANLMEEKTWMEERYDRLCQNEEHTKRQMLNVMDENASLRAEVRGLRDQLEKQWPARRQREAETELIRAAKAIVALAEETSSSSLKRSAAPVQQLSLQLSSE